ncbi:hypothetical protein EV1_019636 [Malus domestica]
MLHNYNLIAALSMILFNMMYLEPRSTKVMFERTKIKKEEGRGRERVHVDARISMEAGHSSSIRLPLKVNPQSRRLHKSRRGSNRWLSLILRGLTRCQSAQVECDVPVKLGFASAISALATTLPFAIQCKLLQLTLVRF